LFGFRNYKAGLISVAFIFFISSRRY
jgi:hypothetical protein